MSSPAGSRLRATLRGMAGAFRAGWAIETNWAHPVVNAFFTLLRPVGASLILVFIYRVAAGGASDPVLLAWLIVGAALWSYVMSALQGISFAVQQEREWLKVLKYVVVTPLPFSAYLLGRSGTWVVWGTIRSAFVLAVTVPVLGLPITLGSIRWGELAAAMALGLVALAGMGIGLAGVALGVARHPMGVGEGVIGVLYLISGAIFPIGQLPGWLEATARVIPLTYWLEACRLALIGGYDPTRSGIADPWAPLALTGTIWLLLGVGAFRWFNHRARRDGLYDRTTDY
ncbi:MAG TPA: ABC transporter permease [Acidimicrobiia bacterium]|nr:ABC transporter permease [Acidimicrobiia bacterium]